MTAIKTSQEQFNQQYSAAVTAVDAALECYLQSLRDVPEGLTESFWYSFRAGG